MMNHERSNLPLLIGFSVARTGEDNLPGHYDTQQDVWVLDCHDGIKPIIEIAANISELESKTSVARERDDPGTILYLESSTKTDVKAERDDAAIPMMDLLQLFTKTKVQSERDDS